MIQIQSLSAVLLQRRRFTHQHLLAKRLTVVAPDCRLLIAFDAFLTCLSHANHARADSCTQVMARRWLNFR